MAIMPVRVHLPVAGLYNSALARRPELPSPPAPSPCPLARSVDVLERSADVHAAGVRPDAGTLGARGRGIDSQPDREQVHSDGYLKCGCSLCLNHNALLQ